MVADTVATRSGNTSEGIPSTTLSPPRCEDCLHELPQIKSTHGLASLWIVIERGSSSGVGPSVVRAHHASRDRAHAPFPHVEPFPTAQPTSCHPADLSLPITSPAHTQHLHLAAHVCVECAEWRHLPIQSQLSIRRQRIHHRHSFRRVQRRHAWRARARLGVCSSPAGLC